MQSVLQQPLLHFLALGAVLFAIDLYLLDDVDDPRNIVIDDAKYAEIAGIFRDNQGREPTEREMEQLTITWAQNEVLYREARLMGLDKGDEMIRDRLILKLRNVFFNRVEKPRVDEEELSAWFEANRVRYDRPQSFNWEQVFLGKDLDESASLSIIDSFESDGLPEQLAHVVRRYPRRPKVNFATFFGEDSAQRMIDAPLTEWVAVTSPKGWHAARITARFDAEPATLDEYRVRVVADWQKDEMDRELRSAMAAMADGYDIRMELSDAVRDLTAERMETARSVDVQTGGR